MTAFLWGSGNFSLGISSKRHSPRLAVLVGFAAGLLGALVYLGIARPEWHSQALVWGAASGLAQGAGWGLLSYAMHVGRVSLVAPISAAGTSTFVFLWGLITGDSASAIALTGAVMVLLSIAFLTMESEDEVDAVVGDVGARRSSRRASLLAVSVAACFATQAICLNHVSNEESSVVMFGARLAVVALIGLVVLFRPVRTHRIDRNLFPAIWGGLLLLVGDIVYLAALRDGPISVAGVLSGANPAVTIVLAALVLRERLHRLQCAGVIIALAGSALLAHG